MQAVSISINVVLKVLFSHRYLKTVFIIIMIINVVIETITQGIWWNLPKFIPLQGWLRASCSNRQLNRLKVGQKAK